MLDVTTHPIAANAPAIERPPSLSARQLLLLKWTIIALCGAGIAAVPVPTGITSQAWRLLAIFAATIVGSILRPIPGGAMVLLGVTAVAVSGALRVEQVLLGYADPIVWLVLAAFMISRGLIKTGLGRRIAFLFIRAIGKRSLGLGYALVITDMVLAAVIPSNGARSGGIIFPIAKSVSEAFESRPGPTAARLGTFLMTLLYQCEVIICAMFLTGQASNAIIAKFAQQAAGIELTYTRWFVGAIAPGIVSLLVIPLALYRFFPPEIKETPEAAEMARNELKRMGRMSWHEIIMLLGFLLVAGLWMTLKLHSIHFAVVPLIGIGVLLLSGVLDWADVVEEREAWSVFIWYGGLVCMAGALGETGITKRFAEVTGGLAVGWKWWTALGMLALVYFYVHYGFASITAHVTSMYVPFLIVIIAAGAPPILAVLSLAYISNLSASLTHYGTTPAPIYFGAGYVTQRRWWSVGLFASVPNILIWTGVGFLWWKILGWW
ncbi:MAG TPA: DASS family sodium-coupled anion symporter [Pyrinomonadaceae bacterium]|nr:DASS family sodium-coupled anion symporter [Pyrinomonadaceae bacterium]